MVDATAGPNRPAPPRVANDLGRSPFRYAGGPGEAGLRRVLGPFPNRTGVAIGALASAVATIPIVAPCNRGLAAAFHAFIVLIEERTFGADDFGAAVAIGFVAVLAGQRAHPRLLLPDRVERIGVDGPDIEFRPGLAIERRQRTLRLRVPLTVGGRRGEATDAA